MTCSRGGGSCNVALIRNGRVVIRVPGCFAKGQDPFDAIVTGDSKDATNFGRCPIVVDIREVHQAWKSMFRRRDQTRPTVGDPGGVGVRRRTPSRVGPNPFISPQVGGDVAHTYTWEPENLAAALGIEVSSLGLMQALHGHDNEPGHPASYSPQSPFHMFQHAIGELETIKNNLNDDDEFPCVLSLLFAYVAGDERVALSPEQDKFWSDWFGGSWDVRTEHGQARRAYALTVLGALNDFQYHAPRRYYDKEATRRHIDRTIMAARLPNLTAAELKRIATSPPYPSIDTDSDTE